MRPFRRRELLAGALTASAAHAQAKPVRFGLIGCGGRGTRVATVMVEEAGAQITALADLFPDKLEKAKTHFDGVLERRGLPPIDARRLYRGPEAHLRLAASDVDAVIVALPPYFYPQVLAGVIRSRKHIYSEKPVATDVAGCLRVMDLAEKATGKFTWHIGHQLRSVPAMRELVERIHSGAIGHIVTAQSYFYWAGGNRQPPPGLSRDEARIRAWGGDRILSGDIMVEQNVHSIDKLNWVLKAHPVSAVARGGRKARTDFGDIWDHFVAQLCYPENLTVSFNSTQFLKGWTDTCERFFGTKGVSESHYTGGVRIYGENPWDAGVKEITWQGDVYKTREFVDEIRTGKYRNEAARGAESTLSAILVRTAAYRRREVTWDELVGSNEKWDAHIDLGRFA